jgi:hypothetical protein
MNLRRCALLLLGLAIVLAGLAPVDMPKARAAGLASYVSSDFCGALVIHPQRIDKSTLADALKSGLPKDTPTADPEKAMVAALSQIKDLPPGMDTAKLAKLIAGKQIVRIVVLIDPLPLPAVPAAPAVIVQFGEDTAPVSRPAWQQSIASRPSRERPAGWCR